MIANSVAGIGAILGALVASTGNIAADDFSHTERKLKAALAMPHRSAKNRIRDENRNPIEAMRFCRLRDNMTVVEFGPGSGWYTEILGPVLRETGRLFIAYKASWMKRLKPLLARGFMSAVREHPIDIS